MKKISLAIISVKRIKKILKLYSLVVLKDWAVDGSVWSFESMCLVGYKVAFTIPFSILGYRLSCRKMLLHIAVLHFTAICHKNNVDMKNAYMDLYSRHRI